MHLLLLGSGGREHALACSLHKCAHVSKISWAPGMQKLDCIGKVDDLVSWAVEHSVDLVVPGSEDYLVDGINDAFKKVGIAVFGPTAKAARLEGSKVFSKEFMRDAGIPTAKFETFGDFSKAREFLIRNQNVKWVVKASGLAAGKGVFLPEDLEQGISALEDLMINKKFKNAGCQVVIEERLEGDEVSVLAFTDGYTIVPFPAAQDHKRALDGDQGLNTGGMGAYAPAPMYTLEMASLVKRTILQPTVDAMRKFGYPFVGLLYTGLMLTPSGPKVLEYNVRFGDPETQVLLPLLETDLSEIMIACVEHRLDAVPVKFKNMVASTVVLASQGYPEAYETGKLISLPLEIPENVMIYYAGASRPSNSSNDTVPKDAIVTSGGRVMAVTGLGSNLANALKAAYAIVNQVHFEGKHYRKDIGFRALKYDQKNTRLTYENSGVSIDSGNLLVDKIKPLIKATKRSGADAEIGGFGGIFDLKELLSSIPDPVLVSGTDGVGTKLTVAQIMRKHDTIGIDLVAMSVNDVLVQGAEPLFFLDYFASSKLEVDVAKDVVAGICAGCIESNCALIGGETAEMPGIYKSGDYDLAGFVVGIADRSSILPRMDLMQSGDIILGLESSGIHSNGYSLVRHIISLHCPNSYSSSCPFPTSIPGQSLGDALLTPTRIYVKSLLPIIKKGLIKGISHITGGGFTENIPRILPDHLSANIDASSWTLPPVFKWLKSTGGIENLELARTFNCGIGMVLIVSKENESLVTESLRLSGECVHKIGQVMSRESNAKSVLIEGMACWG